MHNDAIIEAPATREVCRYTAVWYVSVFLKQQLKTRQRFVDRVIGNWRRRLECVVQQQGGHIELFMLKLQAVTITETINKLF